MDDGEFNENPAYFPASLALDVLKGTIYDDSSSQ